MTHPTGPTPRRRPAVVLVVGAGPRGTSLVERLAAHAPGVLDGRALEIHVADPFPFGAGRLWRLDQPETWRPDATTDLTVLPGGPSLHEWAPDTSGPTSRRRLGQYLTWAFGQTVRTAPAAVTIRTHRATVVDVSGEGHGPQRATLDSGETLGADVVLLAQGLPGREPTGEQQDRATFAEWHGLSYTRPRDGDAPDLATVLAGVDVFVREAGPLTDDVLAVLLEGRGGRFVTAPDGSRRYRPSGAEPRVHLLAPERPTWTHETVRPPGQEWAQRRAALVRAGVVVLRRATDELRTDAVRGAFVLHGDAGTVAARTLIEPDTGLGALRSSADPLVRTLAARGELAGWSPTGATLDRSGHTHGRRFAFGPLVGGAADLSGGAVPAETDPAARRVLALLAGLSATAAPAARVRALV